MSAQNRTALKALVTAWAATLDLEATHKPTEQHILDSVLLNRDVTNTVTLAASSTVDFSGYDTIIANTTVSSAITISNLVDGEIKYLVVNKNTGNAITFANATAMDFNPTYTNTLTLVVYKLVSKGSAGILAIPQHKSFDYSAILTSASITPGAWQEATLVSPWLGWTFINRAGVWYRKNVDYLDISISVNRVLAGSSLITILPVGYRPLYDYIMPYIDVSSSPNTGGVQIMTNGTVMVNPNNNYPTSLSFTHSIPLT